MKISIFRGASDLTLVNGVFQEYRDAKVQFRKRLTSRSETHDILRKYFNLEGENL